MNNERFEKCVSEYLGRINENLIVKAKEYATSGDRLHNFNRGANITGESRERVLFGFALKHLISVMDMIDNIDQGKLPSEATIDEKVGDLGSYMALLYASLKDRIDNDKEGK